MGGIDLEWPQSRCALVGATALVKLLGQLGGDWDYDVDRDARQSVLNALSLMGANAKPVVPELVKLLGEGVGKGGRVSRTAWQALGKIEPEWPQNPAAQEWLLPLVKYLAGC